MKAGELNKTVTFRRQTISHNSYNEAKPAYADAFSVWASVITTGGREFYAAQKLNAETSAVFKVRYNSSINNKMLIKFGNRTFKILSINDVNSKHAELQIACEEVK